MSSVIRIQDDAKEIALSYGPTVSEGVRVMQRLIRQKTQCSFDLEGVRGVIQEELEMIRGY